MEAQAVSHGFLLIALQGVWLYLFGSDVAIERLV
jgi:hypothetical protein